MPEILRMWNCLCNFRLDAFLGQFIPTSPIVLLSYMATRSFSPDRPRSPTSPTITYHPSLFPANIPTPALLESAVGGAHYSGVKIERDTSKLRRDSSGKRASYLQVNGDHQRVLDDLKELYCCRPTREILERRWRPDACFEVRPH